MILEAILGTAVAAYVVEQVMRKKSNDRKEMVDFAVAVMEEGIAYAEENMRVRKREAAHNAGLAIKKLPVEESKDPIKVERFFNSAMKPIRDITHDMAKKYIIDTVTKIGNKDLLKMINVNTIDDAIRLRIVAAKIQIVDPLRPYFFKFL